MVIQKSGTNQSGERMNPAIALARSLEKRERDRGSSQVDARGLLASKLRVGIGTFENLVRNRVKRVDSTIRDRLRDLLIRELQADMIRLDHELQMVRQIGGSLASEQVCEIEAHLAKAKELLAQAVS